MERLKNLDEVIAAAETAGPMLQFDETDTLFGKRSDVQDTHDRYANLEIAYRGTRVLQRLRRKT